VVVGIAPRIENRTVMRQRMHKAGPAVGAFGLAQEILVERDLAALRVPADLGGLGEAVDLQGVRQPIKSAC
jgi:hypothetical protein